MNITKLKDILLTLKYGLKPLGIFCSIITLLVIFMSLNPQYVLCMCLGILFFGLWYAMGAVRRQGKYNYEDDL